MKKYIFGFMCLTLSLLSAVSFAEEEFVESCFTLEEEPDTGVIYRAPPQNTETLLSLANTQILDNQDTDNFTSYHAAQVSQEELWDKGSTINICFLENHLDKIKKVKESSSEWLRHANIKFNFLGSCSEAASHVTIAFNDDKGNWSKLGKLKAIQVPYKEPTMNFSFRELSRSGDRGTSTIIHEFGHMLGRYHEHQSIDADIEWLPLNEFLLAYKKSYPFNTWEDWKIKSNVYDRFVQQPPGFTFDPDSIMMYNIDPSWTKNGKGYKRKNVLSKMDIEWAKYAYPQNFSNATNNNVLSNINWELSDRYLGPIGPNEKKYWEWSLNLYGSGLDEVRKVVYHLHKSFPNPDVEIVDSSTGFKITNQGWATFVVVADVYFKGSTNPQKFSVPLKFKDVATNNSSLSLNNTSTDTGKSIVIQGKNYTLKNWSVFITGDSTQLNNVSKVEYNLHPTFNPSVISVSSSPNNGFKLDRSGWDTFKVFAKVFFKDGSTTLLKKELVF